MENFVDVGTDSSAPFCAYGDESCYQDRLVYAFAIFRRQDIEKAEKVLEFLRDKYKIPSEIPLHCRVLYNGHQREKNGLQHLSPEDVTEIISKLVYHLSKLPVLCSFAYFDHSKISNQDVFVPGVGNWETIPNEPKGILGLLMKSCFAVADDGSQGPRSEKCEIFISAEPTKIKFLGDTRYQAHKGYSGFTDIRPMDGKVYKIQPHIISSKQWRDFPLIQIADIFSYICSHVEPSLLDNNSFTKILKTMRWVRRKFVLDLQE